MCYIYTYLFYTTFVVNKMHNVIHFRPKQLQFVICECWENMVLRSIYGSVFILPNTLEWFLLKTAWLDEAYLIIPFFSVTFKGTEYALIPK